MNSVNLTKILLLKNKIKTIKGDLLPNELQGLYKSLIALEENTSEENTSEKNMQENFDNFLTEFLAAQPFLNKLAEDLEKSLTEAENLSNDIKFLTNADDLKQSLEVIGSRIKTFEQLFTTLQQIEPNKIKAEAFNLESLKKQYEKGEDIIKKNNAKMAEILKYFPFLKNITQDITTNETCSELILNPSENNVKDFIELLTHGTAPFIIEKNNDNFLLFLLNNLGFDKFKTDVLENKNLIEKQGTKFKEVIEKFNNLDFKYILSDMVLLHSSENETQTFLNNGFSVVKDPEKDLIFKFTIYKDKNPFVEYNESDAIVKIFDENGNNLFSRQTLQLLKKTSFIVGHLFKEFFLIDYRGAKHKNHYFSLGDARVQDKSSIDFLSTTKLIESKIIQYLIENKSHAEMIANLKEDIANLNHLAITVNANHSGENYQFYSKMISSLTNFKKGSTTLCSVLCDNNKDTQDKEKRYDEFFMKYLLPNLCTFLPNTDTIEKKLKQNSSFEEGDFKNFSTSDNFEFRPLKVLIYALESLSLHQNYGELDDYRPSLIKDAVIKYEKFRTKTDNIALNLPQIDPEIIKKAAYNKRSNNPNEAKRIIELLKENKPVTQDTVYDKQNSIVDLAQIPHNENQSQLSKVHSDNNEKTQNNQTTKREIV